MAFAEKLADRIRPLSSVVLCCRGTMTGVDGRLLTADMTPEQVRALAHDVAELLPTHTVELGWNDSEMLIRRLAARAETLSQ